MSEHRDGTTADSDITIRRGTPADAATVAHQRACMFRDMGRVDDGLQSDLVRASVAVFERGLLSGEYLAWFACHRQQPEHVIAGAGVLLRQIPPYPMGLGTPDAHIAAGKSAHIVNVYVEPHARRRGLARALMQEIRQFVDAERIDNVTLHASDDGRPLYEQLGFVATNEMRLPPRSFPG